MTVFSKNLGGHGLIAPPPATPMAPAPSHTEMHVRSIFPLLWLLLSFEMDFSTKRPLSDY